MITEDPTILCRCTDMKPLRSGQYVPCGRCDGCRLKDAIEIHLRIILEAEGYRKSVHATLTYKDKIQSCWDKGRAHCESLGDSTSLMNAKEFENSWEFFNRTNYLPKKLLNRYLFKSQSKGFGRPYLTEKNIEHHRKTNQQCIDRYGYLYEKYMPDGKRSYTYPIPRYLRDKIWPSDILYASRFVINETLPEVRKREFVKNENYPEWHASGFFYPNGKSYEDVCYIDEK